MQLSEDGFQQVYPHGIWSRYPKSSCSDVATKLFILALTAWQDTAAGCSILGQLSWHAADTLGRQYIEV